MNANRLRALRNHIAQLPESKFSLYEYVVSPEVSSWEKPKHGSVASFLKEPGACGDMCAWTIALFGDRTWEDYHDDLWDFAGETERLLELSSEQLHHLNLWVPNIDQRDLVVGRIDTILPVRVIDYLAIARELSGG